MRQLLALALLQVLFATGCWETPPFPEAESADATTLTDVAIAQPHCDGPGWIAVVVHDGAMPVPTCAPDFPIWGWEPESPPALESPTAGVVVDPLTHRAWQSEARAAALDWHSAFQYCDALELGGHADWRLPTLAELDSLTDPARFAPASPTALHDAEGSVLWSLVPSGDRQWVLSLRQGSPALRARSDPAQTRCVRLDQPDPVLPSPRFLQTPREAVEDRATGLLWQQIMSVNTYTFIKAMGYCAQSTQGGHGWRLPSLRELTGILTRSGGTLLDPHLFGETAGDYWTSTLYAGPEIGAWRVDFDVGTWGPFDSSGHATLRCVKDPCGDGYCAPAESPTSCVADCEAVLEVPAGTFWQGCLEANADACAATALPGQTRAASAFAIDANEVTVAQYESCTIAKACTAAGSDTQVGSAPAPDATSPGARPAAVNYVTFDQARNYCQKWRGTGFDLPTEAEWERAARAPCSAGQGADACRAAATKYPWGNDAPDCTRAVFAGAGAADVALMVCVNNPTCACGIRGPDVVGARPAGAAPSGAHDLAGNVAEWVRRDEVSDAESVVVRGGSFLSAAANVQITARETVPRTTAAAHIGFRCARSGGP